MTGPDDPEPMESGDRVTLVDQTGKESPVLVRILRAVTPRTFSARLARSRWGSRINSRLVRLDLNSIFIVKAVFAQ